MALQPLVDYRLLIVEASRLHSNSSHMVRLLWTSDQLYAVTSASQHITLKRDREIAMPLAGFEPTISASEWPQTHALDRAAFAQYYFMEI
jgi:hypothetical protein